MGDRGRGWGGGRVKRKVRRYYKTVYPDVCAIDFGDDENLCYNRRGGGDYLRLCV